MMPVQPALVVGQPKATCAVAMMPVQPALVVGQPKTMRVVVNGQGPAGNNGSSGVQSSDGSITDIVRMTQAAYDLLDPPDPTTLYIITED